MTDMYEKLKKCKEFKMIKKFLLIALSFTGLLSAGMNEEELLQFDQELLSKIYDIGIELARHEKIYDWYRLTRSVEAVYNNVDWFPSYVKSDAFLHQGVLVKAKGIVTAFGIDEVDFVWEAMDLLKIGLRKESKIYEPFICRYAATFQNIFVQFDRVTLGQPTFEKFKEMIFSIENPRDSFRLVGVSMDELGFSIRKPIEGPQEFENVYQAIDLILRLEEDILYYM